MKVARMGMLKTLPLIAVDGRPATFATPDAALRLLQQLDRAAGGSILSADHGINQAMREQYIVRSLTEEAITSSQLEGAVTTREVAKQMIRTKRPPRNVSEQMIMNNYRAMEAIRAQKDKPLTPEFVFELHRIVTKDTLEKPDTVGRFRTSEERISVQDEYGEILHTPPQAEKLPERIIDMCEFANGKETEGFVHPIIRAIILHFWLAYDHPFFDGNGRCARALFYWSMLHEGYWLSEFISISQIVKKAPIKYGRAFLYTETDDNDLTYFILYHLDVLRRAIDELHHYIERKTHELHEAEKVIRARDDLNHRQLELLNHALRHSDAAYTIRAHQASHQVAYDTARADLFGLAKKGYLTESRRGREYLFRPDKGLHSRLGSM